MGQIITFGEVLMRISPRGNRKFIQSNTVEFYFGGTEVNVGLSIAHFGGNVKHITCISDDFIGDTAISYLNKFDLDTTAIIRTNRPLGVYFLEVGAVMRPSSISYNRSHSAFSEIKPHMVDWEKSLANGNWFHWTGITPALTQGSFDTLKEGLKLAKEKGMQVSADPTYRSGLWQYGVNSREALTELLHCSTIFIGGINEMNEVLGTNFGYTNDEFIEASKMLIEKFPSIVKVFDKIRTSINASWHKIRARMWNGEDFRETEDFDITHIVDRIGTGDAFAAGLIYGLQYYDDYKSMQFASAACALKHTYVGDVNYATIEEVTRILDGNVSGRFNR
ncbi:sugar kinase [Jejuia pallidilutea]|jgi:2-dehydro-3-deoxygluconokinase|uniref:2-dehydro-3-deoxygluconate kinase n=1 Tax=Jejuia pallidilutea TaxID=504487 RepID=A0A090W466_9FLAO|nr:sugar kinase [Jejuia pallidilutea]PQV51289.1 2-dehydro-3-deoxygluconokinase [Jejuia pallidilutea]GAL66953.1 2-dehydro-3-deoxygluconate kinase [Jejuia pallidilutea]GAL70259.1 2-dehydro-3-deoxygluconate kinase [Jejuia pallidilutea]GAL90361.1 2-dehydro-3-deoxygluconate kinase [Jejuia pallidilutea]